MDKEKCKKAMALMKEMVQRDVNGKPYPTIKVNEIRYCGGYEIILSKASLLHDSDLSALLGITSALAISLRLYLDEKYISLVWYLNQFLPFGLPKGFYKQL